jgi:hypothetical protein
MLEKIERIGDKLRWRAYSPINFNISPILLFGFRYLHRLGIVFGVLLATSACLPVTSKSPVGTTVGYRADPQLTGLWKGRPVGLPGYFAFFPQADGSTKVIWLNLPASRDRGGWIVFNVHTATLGSDLYMDASGIETDGGPFDPKLEHIPVLYGFGADGSLALSLMDEDAVRHAIEAGRIAGVVETRAFGDVVLTASPDALDAFLATPAGHALFKRVAILDRVSS